MIKRMLSFVLALVMVLGMVPVGHVHAAQGPAPLTNPKIQPVLHSSGDYVGYYDGEVSCDSSFKVRWKDMDADSYNVAVKLLDGEPNFGNNEKGTDLYAYTEGYTRTYVQLTQAKMERAAGKWIKVFVSAVFGSRSYGAHYYFRVAELSAGEPPVLTNPDIEPELIESGATFEEYAGIYEKQVPWDSSLRVRWEDVDADCYNVAAIVLKGEPNPGDEEPAFSTLLEYTSDYSRSYISLSQSQLESAAGKWVKVFIQAEFPSKHYSCHYYFRVEAKEDAFDVSRTSVSMDWEEENEASVQISGTDSYDYAVEYDVPPDMAPGFNYEWLEVEDTGDGLVFTPNRPNYSASERVAEVTVTSGAESKVITVTQAACGEAAPTLQLHRLEAYFSDGDSIGTFLNPQPMMEVDIASTNVRKVTANLYNSAGDYLGCSTNISKIILDTSNLPGGQYRIEIYASNSDTSNDYWKQSPFAGGVLNLYFRLRDPSQAGPKDFANFDEANAIMVAEKSFDWSEVGKINYVQQYFDGAYYLYVDNNTEKGYWKSTSEAEGRCTRAAASMALSYMGLTAFPKSFTETNVPYDGYAQTLGCTTALVDRESKGETITLQEFEEWYERYAKDTTGQYSPIVLHFTYAKTSGGKLQYNDDGSLKTGPHAFTIIGRDSNLDNCYYVADSGRNPSRTRDNAGRLMAGLGRIQVTEVNGELRIVEFVKIDGNTSIRYDVSHPMRRMWQYVRKDAPEIPDIPEELPDLPGEDLELSQTSVHMTWGADNEAAVQVTGVDSFDYSVSYDVPAGIHQDYNYEWLNCTASGNTLTLTPNRANYAGEARTARVTVTAGNQSKTITVTQAACGEAAPALEITHGDTLCYDGSFLGTFPAAGEELNLSIASSNVRKVTAYLCDANGEKLAESTDVQCLSFDLSRLNPGSYTIVVYASNSDTPNDYWKQSPFAGGSMTLGFDIQAEHVHDYEPEFTLATCTEPGYITNTCATCGHSYVDGYTEPLGHDFTQWTQSIAPSCFFGGLEVRECTREGCTYEESRDTPNIPHSYESVITEPTCTAQGYTTHTCTACGDSYVDSPLEALGHAWDEGVVLKEATETELGLLRNTCLRCGATEDWPIPIVEHVHNYEAVVTAPTCTQEGYTTYICRCGDSYVSDEVPALGHNMSQWAVSVEAGCETPGQEHSECVREGCDYEENREIPALGHDYEAVVTAPTCTEQGYTTHTCHCGDSYVDSYVPATGHSFGSWTVVKEATCTEKGSERRDCTNCDHFETREIPAAGHDYEAVVTAPTCTEQGFTTHTCHCGDSYVDSYVPATGHSFGNWTVVTEPSCTEKGSERRDCANCDHYETREIAATGHTYESVDTAPTCTEQGYTTHTCHCGDSYVDSYVPATGHSFGSWTVVTEATCTVKGSERRDCANCDHFETRDIQAAGHDYEAVVTAPTCTEQGFTAHTCHCGNFYVDSYVPATGHTPGEAVRENEETDGAHDLVVYCQVCGGELSREHVEGEIPSHVPGDITGDGKLNNKDLTRLFRYLSGFDVEVNQAALDITGDGAVNNKDLTRLFRYLSGFDVEIY